MEKKERETDIVTERERERQSGELKGDRNIKRNVCFQPECIVGNTKKV